MGIKEELIIKLKDLESKNVLGYDETLKDVIPENATIDELKDWLYRLTREHIKDLLNNSSNTVIDVSTWDNDIYTIDYEDNSRRYFKVLPSESIIDKTDWTLLEDNYYMKEIENEV